MKSRTKKSGNSKGKIAKNRSVIGIVSVTILLIAVVTVLSIQSQRSALNVTSDNGGPQVSNENSKPYVTSNQNGEIVVLNRQNGQSRLLTQDETRNLVEGLKQLINQSTEGLVEVKHDNGTISMDLHGHFQNVMLARKEEDGTVTQSCVDNHESAAAFFEIDPKLFGIDKPISTRTSSPAKLEER